MSWGWVWWVKWVIWIEKLWYKYNGVRVFLREAYNWPWRVCVWVCVRVSVCASMCVHECVLWSAIHIYRFKFCNVVLKTQPLVSPNLYHYNNYAFWKQLPFEWNDTYSDLETAQILFLKKANPTCFLQSSLVQCHRLIIQLKYCFVSCTSHLSSLYLSTFLKKV